jgi:hypothetical protein
MPSDNTKLVNVKGKKLEENIAAKEVEFHTRRRYIDEQNVSLKSKESTKG